MRAVKSETCTALNSITFSIPEYDLSPEVLSFVSYLSTSMRIMNIKARNEKAEAAAKHPTDPNESYRNPPMNGPRPTAIVVPSIKYPKASENLPLGNIAVAIVTIALADAPKPIPCMNLTIMSKVMLSTIKYSKQARKWIPMKTSAIFRQPIRSSASPEYILEHSPPKMYIPETSPAIVAVEPIVVAYSVTVDISAYITRAVNSSAPNIRKNDLVKILSDSSAFIVNEFVINYIKKDKVGELNLPCSSLQYHSQHIEVWTG